jgi:hypothetical protein
MGVSVLKWVGSMCVCVVCEFLVHWTTSGQSWWCPEGSRSIHSVNFCTSATRPTSRGPGVSHCTCNCAANSLHNCTCSALAVPFSTANYSWTKFSTRLHACSVIWSYPCSYLGRTVIFDIVGRTVIFDIVLASLPQSSIGQKRIAVQTQKLNREDYSTW